MIKKSYLSAKMPNPYTIYTTAQDSPQDLCKYLKKHRQAFQKPIAAPQRCVFERIVPDLVTTAAIHVDWGCGTGMSTQQLAKTHPNMLVIGIDQSKHRLMKNTWYAKHVGANGLARHQNCLMIHGHIEAFALWLAHQEQCKPICLHSQSFFYPNPWPKRKHLNKRLPTHPIFPYLMRLSSCITMRCNWRTYAQQWAFCAQYFRPDLQHTLTSYIPNEPISLFEKKYMQTHTPCFQVQSTTTAASV